MSVGFSTIRSLFEIHDFSRLALETKFVRRRSSKFEPQSFVLALLKAISSGKCSFFEMAVSLGQLSSKAMTRQGLHQRMDSRCVKFLRCVSESLIEKQAQNSHLENILQKTKLSRLLVEDSSIQKIQKENHVHFPAHGNQNGATAGFKIDLIYNLLNGKLLAQRYEKATTQDRVLGKENLHLFGAGDLVVRDMGYFSMDSFRMIENQGAHWLSRVSVQVKITLPNGRALETLLSKPQMNFLDVEVVMGTQGQKCRLIAYRATEEIAEKRRRHRKNTKKQKRKTTQKSLLRDGWHILLTSLSRELLAAEDAMKIYRMRWDVEIRFRAWKGTLNFEEAFARKSNSNHLESLIYASMIYQTLMMTAGAKLAAIYRAEELSHEKLTTKIWNLLQSLSSFEPETPIRFYPEQSKRERRLRPIPIKQGFACLS